MLLRVIQKAYLSGMLFFWVSITCDYILYVWTYYILSLIHVAIGGYMNIIAKIVLVAREYFRYRVFSLPVTFNGESFVITVVRSNFHVATMHRIPLVRLTTFNPLLTACCNRGRIYVQSGFGGHGDSLTLNAAETAVLLHEFAHVHQNKYTHSYSDLRDRLQLEIECDSYADPTTMREVLVLAHTYAVAGNLLEEADMLSSRISACGSRLSSFLD